MAERAAARRAIKTPGASHAVSVSYPKATADMIPQEELLAHVPHHHPHRVR